MAPAANGHTEVVRLLLAAFADVNARDNNDNTALMYAVERGYTEVVNLLLKTNVDVDAYDKDGQTALMWAWHKNIVKLLKAAGAKETAR